MKAKKEHETDKIEGLTLKIDQMHAQTSKLKEKVATLQDLLGISVAREENTN